MWGYFLAMRSIRRVGFEMESIAFFLSTLSLAVTASSAPGSLFKQLAALLLGLVLFVVLGVFLRDLDRVKRIRWLMAGGAILLLGATLVLGQAKFGAVNWITFGGFSLQPSELAKICYILPEPPRWTGSSGSGIWGSLWRSPPHVLAAWPS